MSDKRYATNNAYLIEPITRNRILDSLFYKQYLFLTNELTILPIIVNHVEYIGGIDSMGRPSPFICCLLRLLELDPSLSIVQECLNQSHFKYLSSLMMLYTRLTIPASELENIYTMLEPYYKDYRKLRFQLTSASRDDQGNITRYKLTYLDNWTETLLVDKRAIGVLLPRLESRDKLEEEGKLSERDYYFSNENNETQDIDTFNGGQEGSEGESSYESDSD